MCYWTSAQPDIHAATTSAINNCRHSNAHCSVVALGDTYVGDSSNSSGNNEVFADLETVGNIALIAGGLTLGVLAAKNGTSVPYVPNFSTTNTNVASPRLNGNCTAQMQQLKAQAGYNTRHLNSGRAGACQAAKMARNLAQRQVELLQRCPMLDPDDRQATASRQFISQAQNTVRDTCVRGAY